MLLKTGTNRTIAIGMVALACAGGIFLMARTLWKVTRSLKDAEVRVAEAGVVKFQSVTLDRALPAGFEIISSTPHFRDAARFAGRFYLCGPSGLFAYDANGSLAARYRPGMELPPSPLVQMATGVAAGSSERVAWMATAGEGLLIFDGQRFTQIRPNEDAFRHLTAVLPLASGRVLLGTEKNGILVWDGHGLAEYHPALAGLEVTALAGSEPDLWIGTMDRGVLRWHAGELQHFSDREGLPDSRVLSLQVTENAAYAGTALGVAEFREGRFTRELADGFFAKALLVDGDSLVVGTLDEGVLRVPLAARAPRTRNTLHVAELEDVERLFAMDGAVFAVARDGLYQQSTKNGGFDKALEIPGAMLTDANVSALDVDRSGRVWTGYFDHGLDIVDAGFERAGRHIEDDHVFCVNRIVHSADGGLSAAGTANGLVLFDAAGAEKQVLLKNDGLIANQVTDVLLRGDSRAPNITVATPAGLTAIDGSGTSSLYAFHGLVNNHVYALAASGSRILAGTLGGLSILDSGIITASFTTANSGLRHNWITAIARVDDDWFAGTYGAGVLKLDSAGRWSTFTDWRSPAVINPTALVVTDRAVYAGTLGQGLAVYDRASSRWVFETRGLPSLNVTALTASNGYLYVGTDNGLVRIVEKDLR